jgi:hypothetical protein
MAETQVSQLATEALVQPPSQARMSQVVAEALIKPPSQARVSQVVVEVLVPNVPVTARPQSAVIWVGG